MAWALQDAKARFSELVDRALTEGPQEVTRHGRAAVMVVATADYRARAAADTPRLSLGKFLLTAPQADFDFVIDPMPLTMNEIDFGLDDDVHDETAA